MSTNGLIFLVTLCIAGSLAIEWRNLRLNVYSLHEIPLTLQELMESGNYSLMAKDSQLFLNFYAFKDDPRVGIGYDSHGNIAGVRVSLIKADLATKATANSLTFPEFYEDKPFYSSGTFFNTDVWYNDVLFVHPSVLKAGGRQETGGLVGEEVYLKLNGVWNAIPRNECNATSNGYTRQNCYPRMGLHYFYDVRNTTKCPELQSAFGLYDNGELIGLGLSSPGVQTATADRSWLEEVNLAFLQNVFADRPDCMLEWFENYGIIGFHIFFNEDPTTIPCSKSVC